MKQWTLFTEEYVEKFKCIWEDFYMWENAVVTDYIGNEMFVIGCQNGVTTHTDEDCPPYSTLLVLRNDGYIAKPSWKGKLHFEPQLAGTVILLNINKNHHCILDPRLPQNPDKKWIALGKDFEVKPSVNQVNQMFRDYLTL